MLWKMIFALMFAGAVAACSANWDIGKGSASVSREKGGNSNEAP